MDRGFMRSGRLRARNTAPAQCSASGDHASDCGRMTRVGETDRSKAILLAITRIAEVCMWKLGSDDGFLVHVAGCESARAVIE